MRLLYALYFALLGMALASFLNVVIDRVPKNESIFSPPSHCPACGHRLAARDLIPVISYLYLRGHCRYCQAPIPKRLLILEASIGVIFALLYWRYGLTLELAAIAFYTCLFTVLMVIDIECGIIPNKIVYPAAAISLAIATFMPGHGIAQAAIGGGIGLGVFLLIVIISRGGMGWGDVKMAALAGIVTGFPMVLVAILLAVFGGGLVALALLLSRVKKPKEGIPFAPYLSLGAVATLLWGADILKWYLGLFPW